MTYVHDKSVAGRVEHAMQSNRQFDHAEIWAEMTSGLRQNLDQLIPHFLCKLRQILFAQRLDIGRGTDSVE